MLAERLAPTLAESEAVLARQMPDEPGAKLALAKAKTHAGKAVPLIRAALHLEGEPHP